MYDYNLDNECEFFKVFYNRYSLVQHTLMKEKKIKSIRFRLKF